MGDFKPLWPNPPLSDVGTSGDGVTQRGGDPLTDTSGTSGLSPVWGQPLVPTPGGSETSNPVSGLPSLPARFEPSESSEQPPDLTDRNPGTIDRK